ncbi:MAG: hypothetical protein AAFY48_07705 [Bacteroidota bacterium]
MSATTTLVLGIESSALPYGIVLLEDGKLIFNSLEHEELNTLKDVPALVEFALRQTAKKAQAITQIMVSQGPGGTSSVRSGVSFANSLAYSLKIPVAAVNAFELMGVAAQLRFACPALITVKSIRGTAYGGWYADGKLQHTLYGPLEEVVKALVDTQAEFAVAGAHREKVKELFPQRQIHDTGQKFGLASDIAQFLPELEARGLIFPHYVLPLTEQSDIFEKVTA